MRGNWHYPFFDTAYKKLLKRPGDFIVEEVIDPKFTRKFLLEGGRVRKMEGRHALCRLEKTGRTTESVLRDICKSLGIHGDRIGYAGLKDKDAITTQFITIENAKQEDIGKIRLNGASINFVQYTNRRIARGDLLCNKFKITLHGIKKKIGILECIERIKEEGFPNYFGPQRFGVNLNNHIAGKLILQGKIREAEKIHGVKINKERARFLVHAYQSFLFNCALFSSIKENRKIRGAVKIIGFDYRRPANRVEKTMFDIAKGDGIGPGDFRVDRLRMMCRGAERETIIKPIGFVSNFSGSKLVLEFALSKGSFATSLLHELLGK